MAVGGNYFSEFLLVCMYCTGIRLSYGMDERERQEKGDKYTTLALSMLGAVTLGRSCVASIRELCASAERTDGQRVCCCCPGGRLPQATLPAHGCWRGQLSG